VGVASRATRFCIDMDGAASSPAPAACPAELVGVGVGGGAPPSGLDAAVAAAADRDAADAPPMPGLCWLWWALFSGGWWKFSPDFP